MEVLSEIKTLSSKIHKNSNLKRLQLEESLLMELVFETKDLTLKAHALKRKKEIDMLTYTMLGE